MESDWQWRSSGLVASGRYRKKRCRLNSLDTCMEYVFLCKLQIAPLLFATWASCFHPMSEILGRSCPIVAEPPVQPLMSYKSQTSIVRIVPIGSMQYIYIFTYIYYKHQPNVGKYTIQGSHWVHHDSIFTTPFWNHQLPNTRLPLHRRCNSMTRWCSSRSCWLSMLRQGPEVRQGWQTISSLRVYNAMSNTKHLKPRDHESKSMWMSRSLVLMSADDLPPGRLLAFLNGHPNVCCLRPCQGARRNCFGGKRVDPYQSSLNFWNWM